MIWLVSIRHTQMRIAACFYVNTLVYDEIGLRVRRRMRTQIGGGTEKPTASHTDKRLMGFLSSTDWKNKQTGLG